MKKLKLIILLCGALLSGCSDWFEVTSDDTTLADKKYFQDETAFSNALTDVYTQLRASSLYGNHLTLGMLEFMAQNFVPEDELSKACTRFDYTDEQVSKAIADTYRDLYRAIASCNKIIEEIETTDVVFFNSGQREQVTGEAYALRASLHFDLLRLFHPAPSVNSAYKALPYMTHFTAQVSEPKTTSELLVLIMHDLTHAEQLLAESDPILWSRNASVVRPGETSRQLRTFAMNYYAVKAIQARVQLYSQHYEAAFTAADKVFDHLRNTESIYQIYYWVTAGRYGNDYSFSREHVFGIASPPEGFTSLADEMFNVRGITTRPGLRNLFANPADIRYRAWFTSAGNDSYLMSNKLGKESMLNDYVPTTTGSSTQLPVRIPYIKLGEVALIAAEALNHLDRTSEALEYLIEAETGKAITYATEMKQNGTPDAEKVDELILDEYKREFWGEGQLFFLYKRMNSRSIPACNGNEQPVDESDYTWPTPANATAIQP